MTETPKCPYCGAEMALKVREEPKSKWNARYVCNKCHSTGPYANECQEKSYAEEVALAYTLHRADSDASCQQLSKALCGKGNTTLDELLEAEEQLKQRAEPELRPLTLDEVKNRCKSPLLAETLFLEFKRGWKSYRFWPRKPTPEQMRAEKWEV